MVMKKIASSLRRSNGGSDSRSPSFGLCDATLQFNIQDPETTDILLGRGRSSWIHPGNQQFRLFVALYLEEFSRSTSINEKGKTIECIYNAVVEKGGRFLKHDLTTNTWFQVERSVALQKISHTLRDAVGLRIKLTPDDCGLPNEVLFPMANETNMTKGNPCCQPAYGANSKQRHDSLLAESPSIKPSRGVIQDSLTSKEIFVEHDQSTVTTNQDTVLTTGSQSDNQSSNHDRRSSQYCCRLKTEKHSFGSKINLCSRFHTLLEGRNGQPDVNRKPAEEKQRGIGTFFTKRSGQEILLKQDAMKNNCDAFERKQTTHRSGSQSMRLTVMSMDHAKAKSSRSETNWNFQPEVVGSRKNPLYESSLFTPSDNSHLQRKKSANRDHTGQMTETSLPHLAEKEVASYHWTKTQRSDGANAISSMDKGNHMIRQLMESSGGKRPRTPEYTSDFLSIQSDSSPLGNHVSSFISNSGSCTDSLEDFQMKSKFNGQSDMQNLLQTTH